ncbi:MAG: hypothetical protein L0Z49_11645 [Actinobacteria bacterium]|nr:hypothetical protein [Actinomycetota bacterium]
MNLTSRLEDIPGVESVTVDLTEEGGGINIRLSPGADETDVLERLRTVLIAYGVRSAGPELAVSEPADPLEGIGVEITITPLPSGGARVEAQSRSVRSFRLVAADPTAIAQGVADAWSQVVGRVPVEIIDVHVTPEGGLLVSARDGETERIGAANTEIGWESALTLAVGRAIGTVAVDVERDLSSI